MKMKDCVGEGRKEREENQRGCAGFCKKKGKRIAFIILYRVLN
jgi:hypothetical protein